MTLASPWPWTGVEIVEPGHLAGLSANVGDASPWGGGSGHYRDPLDYLDRLSSLDAEIFWLCWAKQKRQEDVGALLGMTQASVSSRFRRAVEKLAYVVELDRRGADAVISAMEFISEREREVVRDFARTLQQSETARRMGLKNQSATKWIVTKALRKAERQERSDPGRWGAAASLLRFIWRSRGLRIYS